MSSSKRSNPIDIHVGGRVRLRRMATGMAQERLGELVGVTFQQIQKYEKGTNRIGASRLQQIANVLRVPPGFFFEDAPGGSLSDVPAGAFDPMAFIATVDGMKLAQAVDKIQNDRHRRAIIDLAIALAGEPAVT